MIFGACLHKHLKILFPEGKNFYERFDGSEILKKMLLSYNSVS